MCSLSVCYVCMIVRMLIALTISKKRSAWFYPDLTMTRSVSQTCTAVWLHNSHVSISYANSFRLQTTSVAKRILNTERIVHIHYWESDVVLTGLGGNNKTLSYRWQTARHVYRSVRSPNMVPFDMLGTVSYYAVTLKTGLGVGQGHWKCHHSKKSLYDFLLMIYINYGSISCRLRYSLSKKSRPWNSSQEPIQVIESGTIRQTG